GVNRFFRDVLYFGAGREEAALRLEFGIARDRDACDRRTIHGPLNSLLVFRAHGIEVFLIDVDKEHIEVVPRFRDVWRDLIVFCGLHDRVGGLKPIHHAVLYREEDFACVDGDRVGTQSLEDGEIYRRVLYANLQAGNIVHFVDQLIARRHVAEANGNGAKNFDARCSLGVGFDLLQGRRGEQALGLIPVRRHIGQRENVDLWIKSAEPGRRGNEHLLGAELDRLQFLSDRTKLQVREDANLVPTVRRLFDKLGKDRHRLTVWCIGAFGKTETDDFLRMRERLREK